MEVTKCLKPRIAVTTFGDRASVQARCNRRTLPPDAAPLSWNEFWPKLSIKDRGRCRLAAGWSRSALPIGRRLNRVGPVTDCGRSDFGFCPGWHPSACRAPSQCAMPERIRSLISSRSNSAMPAMIVTIMRPCGVDRSKATPFMAVNTSPSRRLLVAAWFGLEGSVLEINSGPPVLSGLVGPDQGFCSLDDVFRGEAQLTHHNLTGRRRTEAI